MISNELKKVQLYLPNGYANMRDIENYRAHIIIVLGGRGTGKTFGSIKKELEDKTKFLYMRRTQKQLNLAASSEDNAFLYINEELGYNIQSRPISKTENYQFCHCTYDDNEKLVYGDPVAVGVALSSMASQRGFAAVGYSKILFDEIIRQSDEKNLFDEGEAFLNAYESINRNREIKGQDPIKVVMLANANIPNSAILNAFGLLDLVDLMHRKNIDRWEDDNHDIAVFNLKDSPISKKKQDTLIYRVSKHKKFNDMALKNSFAESTYEHILYKTPPLREFVPLVRWENITIYQHKSRTYFYVTRHRSGCCPEYHDLPTERTAYHMEYGGVAAAYDAGLVDFADFASKEVFLQSFAK